MSVFPIRCFLAVPTGTAVVTLRRYAPDQVCDKHPYGYCNTVVEIGRQPVQRRSDGVYEALPRPNEDDPRWPTHCGACGREIPKGEYHNWQISQDELYRPADGNEGAGPLPHLWPTHELPVGAMYYPAWLQPSEENNVDWRCCPTENSVINCITPAWNDGSGRSDWTIDAYCSNCDRKGQKHHCWCRHGVAPWISVNKTPPDEFGTCGAGAGSIWMNFGDPKGFHGFLVDGWLRLA